MIDYLAGIATMVLIYGAGASVGVRRAARAQAETAAQELAVQPVDEQIRALEYALGIVSPTDCLECWRIRREYIERLEASGLATMTCGPVCAEAARKARDE